MSHTVSRRRANTRERLLEAAFEVFADQGFAGASIETIVEAAGFTRGAFYSNFSSKDELFMALIGREIDQRLEAVEAAVQNLDHKPVHGKALCGTAVREVIAAIVTNSAQDRNWHIMVNEFELFALRNPELGQAYLKQHDDYMKQVAEALPPLLDALGLKFSVDSQIGGRLLIAGYLEAARQAYLQSSEDFDIAFAAQMEWFMVLVDRLIIPVSE